MSLSLVEVLVVVVVGFAVAGILARCFDGGERR
jgi:hypothetical protein